MKIQVIGLSIGFQNRLVLDKLNMEAADGEFVAVLGPSGCGKSTFLNILAGLLPRETGEIFVDGECVNGLSPHFAYMPQNDLLLPWKTILDNVCLYGALHGRKKEAIEKASESMGIFGLSGYENSYPGELSGGMRQRAAFLRTALCAADIMLLDEPFASLDVITRGDMQDWLLSMREALNKTTVLVTHDIDEAIFLADRIIVLGGSPASVKREIVINAAKKDREWLFSQHKLRGEIYRTISMLKNGPLF